MSDDAISNFSADDPRLGALHMRIKWLCHAVRIGAVLWFFWGLGLNIWVLSDRRYATRFARYWEVNPDTISEASYWSAVTFTVLTATFSTLPIVYFVWRLARAYLDGDVFTIGSATLLRNVGIAGFCATLVDVASRPLLFGILSRELLAKVEFYQFVLPQHFLYLFISAFVFALGAILKTAAEIAEDNRQIV